MSPEEKDIDKNEKDIEEIADDDSVEYNCYHRMLVSYLLPLGFWTFHYRLVNTSAHVFLKQFLVHACMCTRIFTKHLSDILFSVNSYVDLAWCCCLSCFLFFNSLLFRSRCKIKFMCFTKSITR